MYLLRLNEKVINRKFYYYYFTSPSVKNTLISKKNTSSQGYIKAGSIESLKVPVPPLEVQREISVYWTISQSLHQSLQLEKNSMNFIGISCCFQKKQM